MQPECLSEEATARSADAHALSNGARRPLAPAEWIALLIAVGASLVVYSPLLQNYFTSDDFLNLYRIINCSFWEYVLTPHGGHTLVARNLVFYLCYLAFGIEPEGYFWLVLLTHAANVALLFLVLRRMTGSTRLACFGATLWGTSPVHDGALGWYAVYGHVMATTALLLILRWLLEIDCTRPDEPRRTMRACYIAALIGTMCFGVGIAIAMVLPIVVVLLAPSLRASARWRIPLWSLPLAVPMLYVGLFAVNGFFFGEGVETPALVVKFVVDLWKLIVPNTIHLMSYGVVRLLTSFSFDPSWLTSAATSYLALGIFSAVALIIAATGYNDIRRAMAASALLGLACYAVIAIGRVALFQALTNLMLAIQPRYHYAGLVPLTFLLCLVLASAGRWRRIPPLLKTGALVGALALIGTAYAYSDFQVDHHHDARAQVDELMATVMSKVEAAQIGDNVYVPNRSFGGFFAVSPTVFPGLAGIFAIYHPTNEIEGRHVYFVDKRLGVLVAAARGRRSSSLLVASPTEDEPRHE
jgi:hypothetical protein